VRSGNLFKISVGINYCKINIDTKHEEISRFI